MPNENGTRRKPLNLDALLGDAGQVVLGGRTYSVRPIDGRGYQMVANMGTGMEAVATMYKVAGLCLPDVAEDDIQSLTQAQVEAVIEIATGQVREVEDSQGNPPKAGAKRKRRAPSPN